MKNLFPLFLLLIGACSAPMTTSQNDQIVEVDMLQVRVKYQPSSVEYPKEAKDAKADGNVYVIVTVGKDGLVTSTTAISGPKLLYKSTEDFWSKCQYEPLIRSGRPCAFRFKALTPYRLH